MLAAGQASPAVRSETGMRRLATISFAALLCTASDPVLAANDGLAILGLQEPQVPASAPTEAARPAPARGRYGGGFVELLMNWRRAAGGAGARPACDATVDAGRGHAGAASPAAGSRLLGPGGTRDDRHRHPEKFLLPVEPDG